MGLIRLGTGRDAADVAFATIFGSVGSQAPLIRMHAIDEAARGFELPQHRAQALSTDSASASGLVLHAGTPIADTSRPVTASH